jgi:NAD(P)-dependent dehydrogenase (short-subunit alcohol dehydrogenase family)
MKAANERVVLVTGASSGIGRCCAAFLSERGYRVYGASRSAGTAACEHGVIPLPMDVASDASVLETVTAVLEREGRLDAVVNNAGIAIAGAVEDTSIEEAKRLFDVNFFGVLRVCRAVLPAMRAQGAGCIINIGSIAGLLALPYQALYSASKFALEGLTESLRLEARSFGIRVVLIEPGDHRTGLTQNRRMAEASEKDSVYYTRVQRAVNRMARDEQTGPEPDRVARLAYRIMNTRNPRLRYPVGPATQRAAVWLKRMMPYAVVEKVMTRYYGV